jgi:hypothetical protein
MSILKLLAAIVNLTRAGGLKNINQVYGIAKRELGDKFNAAKKQIDMAFKEGQKQKKLDDRTKDIKKIDESVVAEGIETLADTKSGKSIMDQIQKSKTKIEDASSKITNAQKEIDEMYRPKTDEEIAEKFNKESDLMKRLEDKVKNIAKVENISTGLTRTITREILGKKGIELPKGTDAIELFKQKFGQDILIDINDLAEELIEMDRRGITPKPLTNLIEDAGLFDIKMPKEPPQGYTPDELADIQKEIDQEDILLKFDPTGRKSNSMGGINRIGFADGPKDPKKKTLIDTIKKIPKVGKIVGGAVEIINYVKTLDPIAAMKEVNNVIARKGPYKNVSDKDSQKIFDDTQDHIFGREPKPTEFDIIDDIDEVESTRALAPKMVERLEIKTKYPGIDDELVDKILIDDNPQRKAELLATLDEAFRMMEKGKGTDEIIDTFKNQNRTKQASGTGPEGLSEIVSLYKKINEKNKLKNEEKKSDQQVRYRKLIQSNQFPELNKFFKSKLKESNLNLEPRVNVSIGGPLRIDENKRRQQSYVDFLGRRGTGIGGTGTTTGGTYGSFSNSTPATGGSQPGTGSPGTGGTPPATGGGTGGTSGGSGVIPGYSNFQPNTGATGGGNTGTGNPFYGKGSGGGSKVFFQPSGGSGGSSSGGGKTSAGFSFMTKEDADKEIFADTDPAEYYKTALENSLTNSNPFNVGRAAYSPNQFLTREQQAKARADGTFDDMWKFYEDNKSLISATERKNKSLRGLSADEYIQQFEEQSKNYGQTADDMAMYDMYGDIQNLNPEFYNEDGSLKMVLGEDGEYITAREAAGLEKGVRDKKDFLGAIEFLGYDDEELENLRNPFLSQEEKEAGYEKKLDELEKESIGDGSIIDEIDKQMRAEAELEFYKERGLVPQDATSVAPYAGVTYSPRDQNLNIERNQYMKEKFGDSKENAQEEYRQRLAEKAGLEKPGEDNRTDFYKKVSNDYYGAGADQSVLDLEKLAQSNEVKNLRREVGFENITERTSKEQKKSFLRSISDFASKYKVPLTIVASLVGGPAGAQLAKQVLGANDMARMGVDVVGDVREGDLKGAAETVAGAVIGKNSVDNIKEGSRVLKEKDIKGGVALGTDIALGKGAGDVVRKVLGTEGNQTNEQTAQTNEQTVPKQENQKVAKREPEPEYDGNIGSIFSDGGRVKKALGGPIDLAARKKQSQLDFLARQPGAKPPANQSPSTFNPQSPATQPSGMTSGAATTMGGLTGPGVTQPAVNPQAPSNNTFDMNKIMNFDNYQMDTFRANLSQAEKAQLDNQLNSQGPMAFGHGESNYDQMFGITANERAPGKKYDVEYYESDDISDDDYYAFFDNLKPSEQREYDRQRLRFEGYDYDPDSGMSGDDLFDKFSLSRFGVDESDFYDNMTNEERYDLYDIEQYIDNQMNYGGLYNAAETLEKRGIDPKQFIGSDGMYDRIALTKNYVDSELKDLKEKGFITEEDAQNYGEQTFDEKQRLLKKGQDAYYDSLRSQSYNSYTNTNPGNLAPVKTAKVQMQDIINQQGGMGTGTGNSIKMRASGYMKGGRVGFSSGSERKRIDRNMQTDYSNPFNNLAKVNLSREKAFTNALFKRNKKLVADEKKRKKNLTILNEDARAKALQRLNLLKRLYASGKR